MDLLSQTDLLAKSLHTWVASQQGQLRICEVLADALGSFRCHPLQSVKRAVLIAQACVNQNQDLRLSSVGHLKMLRLLSAASTRISIAKKALMGGSVADRCQELDGLVD